MGTLVRRRESGGTGGLGGTGEPGESNESGDSGGLARERKGEEHESESSSADIINYRPGPHQWLHGSSCNGVNRARSFWEPALDLRRQDTRLWFIRFVRVFQPFLAIFVESFWFVFV